MSKEKLDNQVNSENETLVEVSSPTVIKIELVQANDLRHYEFMLWFATIFSTTAASFWTAYLTSSTKDNILFWTGVASTIVTFTFFGGAYYYRSLLKSGSVKKTASLGDFR
jgi:hypothetical protein